MSELTIHNISAFILDSEAIKTDIYLNNQRQASVFLLLTNMDEPEILFIQKADNPGYPWRNQPAFPGGHVNKYETTLEAAYREIEEELSIPSYDIEHIDTLGLYETINNTVLEAFAGMWNGKSQIVHDESEISRVVMVKVKELLALHEAKKFLDREPDLYELVYSINGIEVWGVTARIVHRFLEIIRKSLSYKTFSLNA